MVVATGGLILILLAHMFYHYVGVEILDVYLLILLHQFLVVNLYKLSRYFSVLATILIHDNNHVVHLLVLLFVFYSNLVRRGVLIF